MPTGKYPHLRIPPNVRFFQKILKTNSCWLWAGTIRPNGYGAFCIENKTILAHQASWIIHYGKIPDMKWVLHTCDVRRCVNPEHLYIGTRKENSRDASERGRMRHSARGSWRKDNALRLS